jgi:hypothetical protein
MFQPAGALKEVPLGCIQASVEDATRRSNPEIGPMEILRVLFSLLQAEQCGQVF